MSDKKFITIPEGKICDYIDNKFRNDTPEEYVRQNIEKRLVNELGYPRDLIRVEYTLQLGSTKPRTDIAIFPKDCPDYNQENAYIIIECKKEDITPTGKKDGVEQLKSYMSACLNCEWGLWSNGKYREVLRKIKNEKGKPTFRRYNDIPAFEGSLEEIDKPTRSSLKRADGDNLLFVFKACHNHIYANDGLQKSDAFFELLKVIFCKIEDERNFPNDLNFYITSEERENPDGRQVAAGRIEGIFKNVKQKFSRIFDKNDEINLDLRSFAWIISELQGYSLLNTNIDVKGKAYEEIVGANLRGDKGQFFTPRNIMKMAIEMINPKAGEKVLDPSCGTGGFLVNSMIHVISSLEEEMIKQTGKSKNEFSDEDKRLLQNTISEIAAKNYFGFDIAPELVKATKMNMVMNNDGSGNILRTNSLLPPQEWDEDFRSTLLIALGVDKKEVKKIKLNHNQIEFFDIIVSNPPFGSKIPIKDANILKQYDIAHIWDKPKKGETHWTKTSKLQSSVPPEQLFIERCLQLLKPGGRMAIVLPDSILGSPGLGYIRQWMLEKAYVIASIDLHADTFQPRNGTQTSILILQKKTEKEINKENKKRIMRPYNIFMAMVEKVGHDKRGNTTYKKDEHGNEILKPEEQNAIELSKTSDGTHTVKALAQAKVIDDQSLYVPEVFTLWKKQEGITW